jgi:hypothetical protein
LDQKVRKNNFSHTTLLTTIKQLVPELGLFAREKWIKASLFVMLMNVTIAYGQTKFEKLQPVHR